MTPLSFGDVVEFQDQRYVFLGASTRLVYLAKIFSSDDTRVGDILRRYSHVAKSGQGGVIKNAVFCYVILTTGDLAGDMVHLLQNGHEPDKISLAALSFLFPLSDLDKDELKRAILEDHAPTSLELRGMFQG